MYPDIDLFLLRLKIFGSFCFIYETKLDSRSLKGIFLDYSATQKDYNFFFIYKLMYLF